MLYRIDCDQLNLNDTKAKEIELAFKILEYLQIGAFEMVEPFRDLQILTNAKLLPQNEVFQN